MSIFFKKNALMISALCFIFLLGITSCKKDNSNIPTKNTERTLPPITTTGAHTFGCYVDGRLWLPYKTTRASLSGDYSGGRIKIFAQEFGSTTTPVENFIISSLSRDLLDTGIYMINGKNVIASFRSESDIYYSNDTIGGYIHITKLDSINFILSGEFSFRAQKTSGKNEIIKIEKGRFDLKYIL